MNIGQTFMSAVPGACYLYSASTFWLLPAGNVVNCPEALDSHMGLKTSSLCVSLHVYLLEIKVEQSSVLGCHVTDP